MPEHVTVASINTSYRLLCALIRDQFPFTGAREYQRFMRRAERYYRSWLRAVTDADRLLVVKTLLASLNDAHTKLGWYPTKIFYAPRECAVKKIDEHYYLLSMSTCIGEILTIDHENPRTILRREQRRISASTTRYRNYRACLFILSSKTRTPLHLTIKDEKGTPRELILPRVRLCTPRLLPASAYMISRRVGYLHIGGWMEDVASKKQITVLITKLRKQHPQHLIIDVRGNGGGDSRLAAFTAAHFLKRETSAGSVLYRKERYIHHSTARMLTIAPHLNPWDIPLTLLIDNACLSSNEYFIAALKDSGRAITIGSTTGGSSGNPRKWIIPYRNTYIEVWISTWRYLRPNGKALEAKGITPDIHVPVTVNALRTNMDPVLAKAMAVAKHRKFAPQP